MYRIPHDIDLSEMIGHYTTQIRVGQFDLQLSVGDVHFSLWSPVRLVREGREVGRWASDEWPDRAFFEILNVDVVRYDVPDDKTIVIYFENGVEMWLADHSDQYESMQIRVGADIGGAWII